MPRYVSPSPLAALVLAFLACDATDDVSTGSGLVDECETVGDTTVVHVVSGSEWGAPATLVEDLAIGSLEGAEEDIFGQVLAIAPDHEGGVYAFDAQAPILRHYDANGRYVDTIGSEGQGPGQYGQFVFGLDVLTDGRILHDGPGRRADLYAPGGEFLEAWPIQAMSFSLDATVVDTAGHVFTAVDARPLAPAGDRRVGPVRVRSAPSGWVGGEGGLDAGAARARPYTLSLETLRGVRTGEFDEQYLVRLRLWLPERAEADAVAGGGS